MSKHYICLTIDTDPDNLNTQNPDRQKLNWSGLDFAIQNFPQLLSDYPLTWYVRADGQLEHVYGSASYLLDKHTDFWQVELNRGNELGWHPHLYTVPRDDEQPQVITDSQLAVTELKRIWAEIKHHPLDLSSFRMGEGWHTAETLNTVEALGFTIDSTAIPARDDSQSGHPRNWKDTPNHPYYPSKSIPRLTGQKRSLLEVPMNSWLFQASYDKKPKLRYMNPCIHHDLWQQAITNWKASLIPSDIHVWVLILHPIETMPREKDDLLYAHSLDVTKQNLSYFAQKIQEQGHSVEFTTVSQAVSIWRDNET